MPHSAIGKWLQIGLICGAAAMSAAALPAMAGTIVYDVQADWTFFNPSGVWSYHAAVNPLRLPSARPDDHVMAGTNTGTSGPDTSFGDHDEGRVYCCDFTVFSAFTQGTYVRFTNPSDAVLDVFMELTPVNPQPPDQAAYIYADYGQIYQGGGPVTLHLGMQPAGLHIEFAIVSLGCCGDAFNLDFQVTATTVREPGALIALGSALVMIGFARARHPRRTPSRDLVHS